MILAILSLLVFASYVGVMIYKTKGIPYSISDTYYILSNRYWFGICMILPSLLLLPAALDASTENSQFLIFLSVVGMIVLGVSPNFKGAHKKAHIAGAVMSLVFSQIWVGCDSWYWLLLWAAFLIYAITFVVKNWSGNLIWDLTACKSMFWIELISLLTVYLTCLL